LAYSTTKFAVLGLSEALRAELSRHGIGVTAVCPGVIDTPITRNARLRGPILDRPEARNELVAAYERRAYGPERVARNILAAIAHNRAVVPVSPEAWALYYLKRFVPGVSGWFSRKFGERSRKQLGGR